MIDLKPEYLIIIQEILNKHVPDCEIRAFGSRVRGHSTHFSDLDLALVSKKIIETHIMDALKEAFSESDLPIRVDVLDWQSVSDSFQKVIEEQFEIL